MNSHNDHLLVQILRKGIKLNGNKLVGYTKNQLAAIGLDKNLLNKGVKLGLVQKISVSSPETPYAQTFYCVDVVEEEVKEEPKDLLESSVES